MATLAMQKTVTTQGEQVTGVPGPATDSVWKPLYRIGAVAAFKDGRPASVTAYTAESADADLVVVGRRGLGGVAEVLLGSVSHELSLHCKRPVLLISEVSTAPALTLTGAAAKEA
jgi:Universal stress protein family